MAPRVVESGQRGSVILGIDRFLQRPRDFLGGIPSPRRIGLLTHDGAWTGPAGPVEETPSRVALQRSGLPLVQLFSPEHGITASAPDGEAVPHGTDNRTGLPVSSLYGSDLRPAPEVLEGLDLVLVDLQDVGARFYTYFWTLSHLMEACAEAAVPVLILDRPNPLGGEACWVEGPMPDPGFPPHFLARWPIPIRHSLTLGEMARLLTAEKKLDLELGVVPAVGWRRELLLTRTALPFHPPSPGLPSPESVLLYPGLALLEATNIWEGRGTPRAFQWFGAPWMDGVRMASEMNRAGFPGVRAHSQALVGPHRGNPCPGVVLEVTDARGTPAGCPRATSPFPSLYLMAGGGGLGSLPHGRSPNGKGTPSPPPGFTGTRGRPGTSPPRGNPVGHRLLDPGTGLVGAGGGTPPL